MGLSKKIGGDFSLLSILPFIGSNNNYFSDSITGRNRHIFETATDSICAILLHHWKSIDKNEFSVWFPLHFCDQTIFRIKNILSNYGSIPKFQFYNTEFELAGQSFLKDDAVLWVHFNRFIPIPTELGDSFKKHNVFVIEDFVLAPFDIYKLTGDAAFNSLRKLSPLNVSVTYSSISFPFFEEIKSQNLCP